MLKEFKEFAMSGNMVDLAIGVIIGAVFGAVVSSLVEDLISPLIGMLFSGDFSNLFMVLKPGKDGANTFTSLAAAKEAGAIVIAYGNFVNVVIKFLLTAMALFMVVKGMNKMKKPAAPAAEEPKGPTAEELLAEIRDALKAK